jgi:hypothetical protein
MTIRRFVQSGISRVADNGMVRQLCGRDSFLQTAWEDMVLPFPLPRSSHMLALAKENLERYFSHVGFAELFHDGLEQMARKFAWRIPDYENKNLGRGRPKRTQLARRDIQLIQEYNRFDMELYNWARKKYG